MENKIILARLESCRANRSAIETKWQDIDRLILPLDQGEFAKSAGEENAKNWSSEEVWDSTAPIGAERLAAMFYSGLIGGRWLGAGFRGVKSPRVNQEPKAKEWLEDSVDRMYEVIMSSAFPSEFASGCRSWVAYGNQGLVKTLLQKNGKYDGFDFMNKAVKDLFFEEDWLGRVGRAYFPLSWTAYQIVSKFRDPKDPTKPHPSIPDNIVQQAQGQDVTTKHAVIYAIFPREGIKPMEPGEKERAPELRPFATRYILVEGQVTLGEDGGEYDMPVYVARYAKSASSQWGYGPALLALPTVKLLNAILETTLNAGLKVVDPATIVTERGLIGDLNLGPQEVTVVRSLEDIAPYESKARFDVSDALIAYLQNMIRKFFREDDITLKESPQMSATEATIRDDRLNRLFGPNVRQMQYDLLAPMVQGVFNDMMREGQLDKPPDIVLNEQPFIQIQFHGQFMRAQRTDEVAGIERLLSAKAAIVKLDPMSRAKHVIKDDQALRDMAERLSVPAAQLASQAEVDAAVQQEQALAMAQAKAQIAKTAGEASRAQAGAQQMMQEGQNGA